jgi:hypothetical protein
MFEKDTPRFATQQLASNVSVEIQGTLWRIIDIRRNNQEPLDYLQVFHLQKSGDMQRITNKQEQPPMEMIVQLELKESKPIVQPFGLWMMAPIVSCCFLMNTD